MFVTKTKRWDAQSPSSFTWSFCLAIVLLLVGFGEPQAGNMVPPERPTNSAKGGSGVLDGQTFTGEYGLVGKSAHGTDTWIFRNGSFLSKGCEECGFPESGYAAYSEAGGVSFKTTTNCPVTDAQIVWEGTVNNGKIEGVWTWTKKRWYRTIRKQFWCRGSIQDTVVDVSDSGS